MNFNTDAEDMRPLPITIPPLIRIAPPSLKDDGFVFLDAPGFRESNVQVETEQLFGSFSPARNAANRLPRALRWGTFIHNRYLWLNRDTYRLDAVDNPQEEGRTRQMGLIPESFLNQPRVQRLLRRVFKAMQFAQDTDRRAYEVQLSAIRYAPTHGGSAIPPPPYPHRDAVDGAVFVLNRRNVMGGVSRIFDNQGKALYEFELGVGQGYLVRDDAVLHYVSDVQLTVGAQDGVRDILIVRYQPLGR